MTSKRWKSIVALIVGLGFSLTLVRAALSAEVTLKSDIADPDGQVTFGEIFDGAGEAAGLVIAQRTGPSAVLDAGAVQAAARRVGLTWANPTGIRRIIVRGGPLAAAGSQNVEVLIYAHSLATGDLVQPQDVIWAKAAGAPTDAPRDAQLVIGLAAKRPLREGSAVSLHDVTAPIVIKAGDTVSVVYSDGGITVTLQAKAMAAAAVGDSLNIQNTASKKVIDAVATGPDMAVVGPEAARMKAQHASPQYAAR